MNIALDMRIKALPVNSELYETMQPFTKTVVNLHFKFDESSTFSSITYPSVFGGSLMSLTIQSFLEQFCSKFPI